MRSNFYGTSKHGNLSYGQPFDVKAELNAAKELYDKGILDEAEYKRACNRIRYNYGRALAATNDLSRLNRLAPAAPVGPGDVKANLAARKLRQMAAAERAMETDSEEGSQTKD